jgi:RNA-splicing ligase RtcB
MKTIKNNKGIETLIFAETFEFEAYDQIKKLVNFEAYENAKVRIMPDAHAGKGCTVGTTITITDKVTPNLVGVDIGCGMLTIKLKNKERVSDDLIVKLEKNNSDCKLLIRLADMLR